VQAPVLLRDPGRVVRPHVAGDEHGRNVQVRVLGGEDRGKRPHAGLAEREAGVGRDRLRHAAGDQDRAGGHARREVGGRGHGAEHVDRVRVLVLRVGQLAGTVRADQPGVVDEHLGRAERVERSLQLRLVGGVGHRRRRTADRGACGLQSRPRARNEADVVSLGRKPPRDRRTDPGSCADDHSQCHDSEPKEPQTPLSKGV
jgi:hypothetical protein